MLFLAKTTHCGINLKGTNWDRFLDLSKRPITVTVHTWIRASDSRMTEWIRLLLPSLRILGNSQPYYHLPCRLFTRYSQPNDSSWNNDLPPLSEGFLDGPLLWVLSQTVRIWNVNTTLCCSFTVCGWLRTARNWRLIIILPDKQMCQQCSAAPLNRIFYESQRLPGCCGEKLLASPGNRNYVPWLANL
jgi:hypothetical protein